MVKRKEMRRAKWSGEQVYRSADVAGGNITPSSVDGGKRTWSQHFPGPR